MKCASLAVLFALFAGTPTALASGAFLQSDLAAEAQADLERARTAIGEGDHATARELSVPTIERLLEDEEIEEQRRVELLWQLGFPAYHSGANEPARDAWLVSVPVYRERLGDDNDNVARSIFFLAIAHRNLSEFEPALDLLGQLLDVHTRAMGADHESTLQVRTQIATTLYMKGDPGGACDEFKAVLEARERALDESDSMLTVSRVDVAAALVEAGRLDEAEVFIPEAIETTVRLEHDAISIAQLRTSLGAVMEKRQNYLRARSLFEGAIAVFEERLPEGNLSLATARMNLGVLLFRMADYVGARAITSRELEVQTALEPEDSIRLNKLRMNLAAILVAEHEYEEALALEERVLASHVRTLGEEHVDTLIVRTNLAVAHVMTGDHAAARALIEPTIELLEADGGAPLTQSLQVLTALELAAGRSEQAVAAARRCVESARADEAPDHRLATHSELLLAAALAHAGDADGIDTVFDHVAAASEEQLLRALSLSRRGAQELAAEERVLLGRLLHATHRLGVGEARERRLFELLESWRHIAHERSDGGASSDPELAALREAALAARLRVNELAIDGSDGDALGVAIRERDQAEAKIRARVARSGGVERVLSAKEVATSLQEGASVVAFQRYRRVRKIGFEDETRLAAHVLTRDAKLARVELCSIEELEMLVADWRAALGKPLTVSRGRGIVEAAASPGGLTARGNALRAAVLDPVLAKVGKAKRLHVCAVDALFLVPLDALPLEGGVVGDRYRIHQKSSLSRLVEKRRPLADARTLLAFGGVDFGDAKGGYEPLPATLAEVRALSSTFKSTFAGAKVDLKTAAAATRESLFTLAPNARYLHVATHGYFDDRGASWDESAGWAMTANEQIRGLAPMALCGLALAGADSGIDGTGRVSGVVTAEELAGLDLSKCELAVLSACETRIGIRRANRGVQSLQSALHAAGARAAITSLWKVSDEWTMKLMTEFYLRLWVAGESKADALWNAKEVLRVHGASTADWAGWVLTGDPR